MLRFEHVSANIPAGQLDSLVAPIALYPDPLLAQVLAASQALAPLPDVVKLLAGDVQWTTDLGNAFLAQESDVMNAVQRMRAKAKQKGKLASNDKMKVETKTVEQQQVIVIEQANPQVVYVPTYDPVVVYGPAPYPCPPGYYAAGVAPSFGVGIVMGAAFSGGWGYGCGWGGHGNVYVNNDDTFVRNSATRTGGQVAGNRGQWQHNPQHRGGAPYSNRATANRYGGATTREGARTQRAEPRPAAGGGADRVGDRNVAPSREPRTGGDALGGGGRGSHDGRSARTSSTRGGSSMGGRGGGRRR